MSGLFRVGRHRFRRLRPRPNRDSHGTRGNNEDAHCFVLISRSASISSFPIVASRSFLSVPSPQQCTNLPAHRGRRGHGSVHRPFLRSGENVTAQPFWNYLHRNEIRTDSFLEIQVLPTIRKFSIRRGSEPTLHQLRDVALNGSRVQ